MLFQQIVDTTVVGRYEAVVVHADNSAVDFFSKFGFSDDIVLNSRWRWANNIFCILYSIEEYLY